MKDEEKTFEEVSKSHELQMEVLGEQWRPKYPRMFDAPAIFKYEAFSSWFARFSGTCHISMSSLKNLLEIEVPVFWVDAGRIPLNLEKISSLIMCDVAHLSHVNWAFDSVLAEFDFSCLTAEILNKRPIYKYCPACLQSDPIPYFRQSWRLASTFICPLHQIILRDTCHQCNKRIDLSNPSGNGFWGFAPASVKFCNQCIAPLDKSPCETIQTKFLSDVFFRQEQIENLIRSTSSYWIPSQFADHHESLSVQPHSKLVWSVGNSQVILKSLIERYGDLANRPITRAENKEKLKDLLHLKKCRITPYSDHTRGIYIALDGPSVFKFLSPYLGLQISKYQSTIGSMIWWDSTIGKHEDFHHMPYSDLDNAIAWCMVKSKKND